MEPALGVWSWAYLVAAFCQMLFIWFLAGRKGLADALGVKPADSGTWLLVLHASFVNLVIAIFMAKSIALPELREVASILGVASIGSFAVLSLFFLIFAGVGALVIRYPGHRGWYVALAVLVVARLENGAGHVLQAVLFRGYTPGVATAVVIVLPISFLILFDFVKEGRIARMSLVWMIPAGFALQLLAVAALAWPAFES